MPKKSKPKYGIVRLKNLVRSRTEEGSRTFHFDIIGNYVRVTIPESASDSVISNYRRIFPSVKIKEDPRANVAVEVLRSTPGFIKVRGNAIMIGSDSAPEQLAIDGLLAASKLIERELNRKRVFSIHAAGVCNDNTGVLLVGPSGSGKTTIAANCCIEDKGLHFIDNRILIRDNKIIGATDLFSMRVGSLVSEFSKHIDCFHLDSVVSEPHDKKISLESYFLMVNLNKKYPLEIRAIVFVKKLPVDLKITEVKDTDAVLPQLHESLSRYSDFLPSFALGAKVAYPSIFNQKLRQRRVNYAQDLLNNIQNFVVEGNLGQLSDFVSRLLRKNS